MSDDLLDRMSRVFRVDRGRLEAARVDEATWELQNILEEISVVAEHGREAALLLAVGYTQRDVVTLARHYPGPLWDVAVSTAQQLALLEVRPEPLAEAADAVHPEGDPEDVGADVPEVKAGAFLV